MRRNRGPIAACMVAALALAITIDAGAAAAAPGASVAAKKKCKKMHSAKAKCKRKKRKSNAMRSPVIRATLTWGNGGSDGADLDLFVFDGNGNMAANGSDTIPLTSITSDVTGRAGSETFTDGLFTPQAARDLSFGVCYSAVGPINPSFTLTYVTADGVVHGDSQNPPGTFHYDYPGGAPIPADYCPIR